MSTLDKHGARTRTFTLPSRDPRPPRLSACYCQGHVDWVLLFGDSPRYGVVLDRRQVRALLRRAREEKVQI